MTSLAYLNTDPTKKVIESAKSNTITFDLNAGVLVVGTPKAPLHFGIHP